MNDNPAAHGEHSLHRALNHRDLVLLNISCIVGLSSLAQVAQFGFGSLSLYLLAIITFLIPTALMVAELNARMPEEGGFYLWTRKAFGDFHGYVAAWTYWLSNIVWLPTVVVLVSVSCLYVIGGDALALAENPWYNGLVCIALIWIVTILNIVGLEHAKWIQNVGGTAIWVCIGLLVIVGIVFVAGHGTAQAISARAFIPDVLNFELLPFFAIVAFSFGGLELAPVMAGEIQNPSRTIPRAIWITAVAVGLIYMVGTLMLIVTIPDGEISVIEGVTQAFHRVGDTLGTPWIGTIGAGLVVLSSMGLFGAWMMGTARVPFVIGLDHYLPEPVGWVHEKWGSPYVSLLMQAVVLTILFVASIAGSTVKEAFLVLLDMSVILYFIPFLYMFAGLIWHIRKDTGGVGLFSVLREKKPVLWSVSMLGFCITLFSVVVSSIPSKDVENGLLFVLKVVGGAVVLIAAGLVVYVIKRKSRAFTTAQSDG